MELVAPASAARGRDRNPRRPRIGLVVDAVENEYQWGIVSAAAAAARDSGALLFALAGGLLQSPGARGEGDNALFDLVTPDSIDAVLVVSGSVGHVLGPDGLAEWARRFDPLPIASIGLELPGCPSFVVENESGTLSATTHLAQAHGHRRIAFVEGTKGSREAEARLKGYLRGLEAAGLSQDPRLIVSGDFTVVGGHAAVAQLFDRERISASALDAIVAANDAMAFGVIEELTRREIDVPRQIAVVGFDDVMLARVGPPPLTSVRQPVDRLAAAAVRNLIAALRGAPEPGAALDTELVIRRSCGCLAASTAVETTSSGLRSASEVVLLARREQVLARLARAARGAMVGAGAGWEQRLLMALIDDARAGGTHLLEAVDSLLSRLNRAGTDPGVLDDILSTLRAEVNAALECGPASQRAEDSFHDTRRVLHDQLMRHRMRERAELSFGMQTITQLARQLRSPRDPQTATDDFVQHTRALGCDAGLVAWLDGAAQTARPVVHYDRAGLRAHLPFPSTGLWPGTDPDTQSGALLFHPILDGQRMVGYCAFALGAVDGTLHELLRELVSDRLRRGPSLLSAPPAPA